MGIVMRIGKLRPILLQGIGKIGIDPDLGKVPTWESHVLCQFISASDIFQAATSIMLSTLTQYEAKIAD